MNVKEDVVLTGITRVGLIDTTDRSEIAPVSDTFVDPAELAIVTIVNIDMKVSLTESSL